MYLQKLFWLLGTDSESAGSNHSENIGGALNTASISIVSGKFKIQTYWHGWL
jgi:hypothetical protein